jgi:hypothetical protein
LLVPAFARDRAGKSIAARIAMMAMTTSSSINVNPLRGCEALFLLLRTLVASVLFKVIGLIGYN